MRALLAYLRIRRVGHEHADRQEKAISHRNSVAVCEGEESGPKEQTEE